MKWEGDREKEQPQREEGQSETSRERRQRNGIQKREKDKIIKTRDCRDRD